MPMKLGAGKAFNHNISGRARVDLIDGSAKGETTAKKHHRIKPPKEAVKRTIYFCQF